MTEVTRAELAKELGIRPTAAKGWTWTWQRCGRYEYRKCLTHSTNPDHLVPRVPSPTNVPPLRIAARYAIGRPRLRHRRPRLLGLPVAGLEAAGYSLESRKRGCES
jgi:hypothetical protein